MSVHVHFTPSERVRVVRSQLNGEVCRLVRLPQVVHENVAVVLALHVAQHELRHRKPPPVRRVARAALFVLVRPEDNISNSTHEPDSVFVCSIYSVHGLKYQRTSRGGSLRRSSAISSTIIIITPLAVDKNEETRTGARRAEVLSSFRSSRSYRRRDSSHFSAESSRRECEWPSSSRICNEPA